MSEYVIKATRKEQSKFAVIWALALILGLIIGSAKANAQMENDAWQFAPQNRASIAAMMRQVEQANDSAGASAVTANTEQLVCGSDGQSSARANATCIILNNSSGTIEIGQDADGNQSANSEETANFNELSAALEGIDG